MNYTVKDTKKITQKFQRPKSNNKTISKEMKRGRRKKMHVGKKQMKKKNEMKQNIKALK